MAHPLGLRARLTALVVASALPALALFSYSAWEQRAGLERQAGDELLRLARVEAQKHGQLVEGARQTLVALSQNYRGFYERGDREGCRDFSARAAKETRGLYQTMGVVRPDGEMFCNAVPWQGRIDASDRSYFRTARDAGRFAIGEYQIGRATGREGISFGLPLRSAAGQLVAVAFISLDIAEFDRRASEAPLPAGAFYAVLDVAGKVLAMRPPNTRIGWIGEPLADAALRDAVKRDHKALEQTVGDDGTAWLVATEPVLRDTDGGVPLRVMIAIPRSEIIAEANLDFARNVAILLVATLLVLALAWWGAEYFVRARLAALLDAAGRVHGGDLAARTGLAGSNDEIGRLARAFDDMTQALQQRDGELQAALKLVQEQAIHDPLTGLYNRRQMEELLAREFLRTQRSGSPFSVVMVDIDHFKRINDQYGHECGDEVLRQVAALLGNAVRRSDIVCRYGGEEFLILLLGASLENALRRAAEIHRSVRNLIVPLRGEPVAIAASFGIAACPEHGTDRDALLRAADGALYRAKNAGRDRIVAADAGPQ